MVSIFCIWVFVFCIFNKDLQMIRIIRVTWYYMISDVNHIHAGLHLDCKLPWDGPHTIRNPGSPQLQALQKNQGICACYFLEYVFVCLLSVFVIVYLGWPSHHLQSWQSLTSGSTEKSRYSCLYYCICHCIYLYLLYFCICHYVFGKVFIALTWGSPSWSLIWLQAIHCAENTITNNNHFNAVLIVLIISMQF